MAFPTIPTAGAGTVLTGVQANTTATRTFPSLSGLTKNAGDLLIAFVVAYQGGTGGATWSSWTAGWTEFTDFGNNTVMSIGAAYKWSDGAETTLAVTQGGTITGHAVFIVLAIPGSHASTPPEGGNSNNGTTAAADIVSLTPAGWDAEDTLWIAVCGNGETGTGGSFTGVNGAPTNYSNLITTGISADVVGGVEGAVAFRQLNAASEDPGTFTVDLSNARNSAYLVAVRPAAPTPKPCPPRKLSQAVNRAATWMKRKSGIVVPKLWVPEGI